MTLTLDPVPAAILTVALAALWAAAGLHKLSDRGRFAGALEAYALLPPGLVAPVSLLLPLTELALAVALLFEASRPVAAVAGALTLAAYAAAIAVNLHRGRRDLDCGCVGFGRRSRISAMQVWRNTVLALASLVAGLVPVSARALDWIDLWTVVCGVGVIALMYVAIEGLAEAAQRLPRRRLR